MLIDGITIADLQLFSDGEGLGGLVGLLEPTETLAGRAEVRRRLLAPESDPEALRELQGAVRFFAERWTMPLLGQDLIGPVDRYLGSNIDLGEGDPWKDSLRACTLPWRDRELCRELRDGVRATSELLVVAESMARRMQESGPPSRVKELTDRILDRCDDIGNVRPSLSFQQTLRTDRRLRQARRGDVRDLIRSVAKLDAMRSLGATTRERGWVFPEILDGDRFVLEGEGLHHPFLQEPVGNPVRISGGEPAVFLTGPNMAGKTTYMRAVGVAVILAQLGTGVPARRLRITPVEVLLTGLDPSDNIRAGLSYFLAEVLRVKEAAEQVASGKRCLLLFDEVFKGTNVRDALAASHDVIVGFARARGSGCLFSSHLVELADSLETVGRVRFVQLDGDVVDGRAVYSYRLRPGVSDRRLGQQLLMEAGVPELMRRIETAAIARP